MVVTGSLVFNPVNAWLVTSFGWRVAFRVASGIIFVSGLLCCWTFSAKETPDMQQLDDESDPGLTQVQRCSRSQF